MPKTTAELAQSLDTFGERRLAGLDRRAKVSGLREYIHGFGLDGRDKSTNDGNAQRRGKNLGSTQVLPAVGDAQIMLRDVIKVCSGRLHKIRCSPQKSSSGSSTLSREKQLAKLNALGVDDTQSAFPSSTQNGNQFSRALQKSHTGNGTVPLL
ncbi:MAG: hypothetical protein KTR25_20655 [Myxococcales bacterium]|nr:hypothetical protein [Myxococcales bacterium]